MTDGNATREPAELPAEIRENVPAWDDEYFDRVSDRLMYSYDLERDYSVRGESFELYGELRMVSQKQFLHPALSYADHETEEYVFARRTDEPTVSELEALTDLGHDLADDWVDADEEHYETNFTFVLVADDLPDDVREFVAGFRDRTLLKFGYYGHYEVHLVVVAPDDEAGVESREAELLDAFALWGDVEQPSEGFFSRLAKRFWT
ncbi:hypothetical protein [Halobacterium bonnevillei]|uniref:DUF8052 domain-containing protein n=1 Tax=Halobacterium bonnevillei TaxID=2692200 RepID=A0A6B0SES3_9EURY|nr:hypothetical protein [Halobacterium bonnevillei]MXR19176.1 hypothetical protein [Halobacterium bonnevillei]